MRRTQPIEIRTDAQFSAFRQVVVQLDAPISVQEHFAFEQEVANHVANFESTPETPFAGMLMIRIKAPRDDADALTQEVDACIEAVNRRMDGYTGERTYL